MPSPCQASLDPDWGRKAVRPIPGCLVQTQAFLTIVIADTSCRNGQTCYANCIITAKNVKILHKSQRKSQQNKPPIAEVISVGVHSAKSAKSNENIKSVKYTNGGKLLKVYRTMTSA